MAHGMLWPAPAKLNLSLRILGRRADGYHLLESLVAFTDLADELSVAPAEDVSLMVNGEFAQAAGAGEGNLVLKAARFLQKVSGTSQGAALKLTKHIPVGAGLGGGSADAAATLHALNDFWKLSFTHDQLYALVRQLGADVAMCLASVPAMARGVGDELTPIAAKLPECHAVLVHPRVPLLTADVYAAYTGAGNNKNNEYHDIISKYSCNELTSFTEFMKGLGGLGNDLQRPAIACCPAVAEVLLALETVQPSPALVRMTGSGACCFAIYADSASAAAAEKQIAADYPQWWVKRCRW